MSKKGDNFVNRGTSIPILNALGEETGETLNFCNLAIMCMNKAPKGGKGFSIDEQEIRLPIISKLKEKLESVGSKIEFSESEVNKLAQQVEEMRSGWSFMHEDLPTFNNYIRDLKNSFKGKD